ncbi:hypothetical protein C1H46_037646 [Malus baccata]|uniref:Uncharacterized protein n=1 Tax=Malus baccata TaxID=106549 RepID=A0A540KRF8_MALBA|nr:hypothetical protein C1H46_037646 [Malus baccata]
MGNHLNYEIYELEPTNINSNSDLYIDRTITLQNGESRDESWRNNNKTQVTLSGLLHFLDGFGHAVVKNAYLSSQRIAKKG